MLEENEELILPINEDDLDELHRVVFSGHEFFWILKTDKGTKIKIVFREEDEEDEEE